jgi:hypothetical protein
VRPVCPYSWILVRNGNDAGVFDSVDDAFGEKRANDMVYVMLVATGFRVPVLRPGPDVRAN